MACYFLLVKSNVSLTPFSKAKVIRLQEGLSTSSLQIMNDEFKLQFGGRMEPGDKEHRINFDRKWQVGDEEYEITINSNDRGYFR